MTSAIDTDSSIDDWSSLEVSMFQGVSRVTVNKSVAPLRLINPRVSGPACHVLISNFGGGLVEGDSVLLDLICRQGARLAVTSVGNQHIYRSGQYGATQRVRGVLERESVAVFGPDPVVPHAESRFRQTQEWYVDPEASLLVAELLAGGRLEIGERFAFKEYSSKISVTVADRRILHDSFRFRPSVDAFDDPAVLAGRSYFLSIAMIGPRWSPSAESLLEESDRLRSRPGATLLSSVHPLGNLGYIVRAVADLKSEVTALLDHVYGFLKGKEFLGFNPRDRKY